MVVDGSGAEPAVGDVAIGGDRIVDVGDEVGAARREIDATGLVVTPGWVDTHTHYDAQATWDPQLTPSGWHGVTTVVMGNCGVGFAPAAPDKRGWLVGLMEGVEDIPGAAMTEGIEWEWETFPQYLDALERRSWVADIGAQLPHGALRAYVMGERAESQPVADPADNEAMSHLVTEALRAGALGFSTSRTPLHKSIAGELVPGTHAALDELQAIADAMAVAGHGVFQCAIHHPDVPESFGWMRQVAATTGRPVIFNLNQPDFAPDLWREDLRLLEQTAAEGLPVLAQVSGRPVGILMCWEGSVHPFLGRPSYEALRELAVDDHLTRLRDPAVRAAILREPAEGLSRFLTFVTSTWEKVWPFTGETDYEPDPADSLAAAAARGGITPDELAYDQMLSGNGTGLLYFPLFNYGQHTLEPLFELHQHPLTRMGLADAGAHCGAICDGGMPTFMISYWTRDRSRGERLPLAHMVRRQTRETAETFGLHDRGLLRPGMRADINVIDYDRLNVVPPRMAHDLPTGARRYVQPAVGYVATVCAGQVTVEGDEFTGAMPGRLIRGPQSPGG